MRANAFERGARAKRRGRSVESNPFARRSGRANAKRANDWLLGWHSCEYTGPAPGEPGVAFAWPPLGDIPRPPEGDYDRRCRGLVALFRPVDMIEWEVLIEEMRLGRVEWVPHWAVVGYTILWFYAESRNWDLGVEPDWSWERASHPMLYLYSCLRIQRGECGRWPPLVVSAFEEL